MFGLTADKVKVTVAINRRIWKEFKVRIPPDWISAELLKRR